MFKSYESIFSALLISLLVYCLHFNVDIGDEGYYLYHFQNGAKVIGLNFYHLLVHPLGELFNHYLIGYRYLNVVLVLGSSLLLFKSVGLIFQTSWFLFLTSGLIYFNQIPTFSYNSLALVAGVAFLSIFYRVHSGARGLIYPAMMGILAFVTFSARFGGGILLLVFGVIQFLWLRPLNWKSAGIMLISFSLPLGFLVSLYPDYFASMRDYLEVVREVSHSGLLQSYFEQGLRYLLRSILIPLVIMFLLRVRWPGFQKIFLAGYVGWFFIQHGIRDFSFNSFMYYLSGLLIALGALKFIELLKSKSVSKEDVIFLFLPPILYLTSAMGTNNNLFKAASGNFLILTPLAAFLLRDKIFRTRLVSVPVGIWCLWVILNAQYLSPYGSTPRAEQEYVTSSRRPLVGIRIDQELENRFKKLEGQLAQHDFDSKLDRLFVYADVPGYISYFEAMAFGISWNSSHYKNSDKANCYGVMTDSFKGRIFVLLTRPLTERLEKCLTVRSLESVVVVL